MALLSIISMHVAAQPPASPYDKQMQLYMQVIKGERRFESLTPTEQS